LQASTLQINLSQSFSQVTPSLAIPCDTFADLELVKPKKKLEIFEMFKHIIRNEGIALDNES